MQNAAVERKCRLTFSLDRINFREREAGTEEPRFELDRFLKEFHALWQPLLLKTNGAQNRAGHGAGLRVSKSQSGLLIRLVKAALLNEVGCFLEGFTRIGVKGESKSEYQKAEQGRTESAADLCSTARTSAFVIK